MSSPSVVVSRTHQNLEIMLRLTTKQTCRKQPVVTSRKNSAQLLCECDKKKSIKSILVLYINVHMLDPRRMSEYGDVVKFQITASTSVMLLHSNTPQTDRSSNC